jgi:hypothetical protein
MVLAVVFGRASDAVTRGLPGSLAGCVSIVLSLALGCGGSIGGPDGTGGEQAVDDGSGGRGTGGVPTQPPEETGGTGGRLGTGGVPYVEPECPDEPPPPVEAECDPLLPADEAGCGAGSGCYPYLVYPYGEACGFPTFGALCAPASTGEQGEICGTTNYCAPGFMCVIGGTAGARCTQICSLMAPSGCPPGLICNETDVVGYGVCF